MKKVFISLAIIAISLVAFFVSKAEREKKIRPQELNSSISDVLEAPLHKLNGENALEVRSVPQAIAKKNALLVSQPAEKLSETTGSIDSLPSAEQKSLWQAFAEARREVHPIPEAWADRPENLGYDLYSIHPKEKLRARFGSDGVQLTSSSRTHTEADQQNVFTAWEAKMQLASFAGEAVSIGSRPVKSSEQSDKVEYYHTSVLSEWYVNGEDGLEHGYTVKARPAHLSKEERVEIEVLLTGLDARKASSENEDLVFRNATDEDILTYSKLKVFDATGRELNAEMGVTEDGFFLVYNDAGAVYPVTVDPLIATEEAKLTANDAAAFDSFGATVSIYQDTVVIGADGDDDGGGSSGSVYVFVRSGNSWNYKQKLTASDALPNDRFGVSVSISEGTLIVGAFLDDGIADNSGSAYVFVRTGNVWIEQQKLEAEDAAEDDLFGRSVSVSGNTVVVGANQDDDAGVSSGSAYVFVRSGSGWSQQQKLTASDAAPIDGFGGSVSVFGDTIVVGAIADDDGGTSSGSAYVFVRSGSVWTEQQKLTASDAAAFDQFGRSVSISEETVVVGAVNVALGMNKTGSVYVFMRSGDVWAQQQKLNASDAAVDDQFGLSVSVSGDTLVVGAQFDDDASTNSGSAYVFVRSGSVWNQQQKLTAADSAAGDRFGVSVSVSGDTVIIGAEFDDENGLGSGSAYVFSRSESEWSQQQKLTANDMGLGDGFGGSIFISGDTLVIGAEFDADGGSRSGSAYVFVRSKGVWSQQQKLTANDASAGDEFGESVSVSGDTVVVGAWLDDDGGITSGSAYVFLRSRNVWSQQQKLTANDAFTGDSFGRRSVSISGDTLVVGAIGDSDGGSRSGSAYVFVRSESVWTQQQKLTASDAAADDQFGIAVSISGDTIVVGAFGDDDGGNSSGSAYVFVRNESVWTQQQKLTASDAAANDFFGGSVSVSGDAVVVGADRDDNFFVIDSGSAYVFVRSGSVWNQQQKLIPNDAGFGDEFGESVSISGDVLVVGAPFDDDAGNSSGSAYVFFRSESEWSQQQKLTANDTPTGDRFGISVSVSGDTFVVGADFDNGSLSNSGSVYLFRHSLVGEVALQVRDWLGNELLSGGASAPFEGISLTQNQAYNFELKNIGTLDLDIQSVSLSGVDANSFSLSVPDVSSSADLVAGASLNYTINFDPAGTTSGERNATVTIGSNDLDTPIFTFDISGLALNAEADLDGDGLDDLAEFLLRPLGFDWQLSQPNLVNHYYEFASEAGLFTQEEAGGITMGFAVADVNPTTNQAGLVIELEQSDDLDTFTPLMANPSNLSVDGQGRIRYEADATDGKKFYRIGVE